MQYKEPDLRNEDTKLYTVIYLASQHIELYDLGLISDSWQSFCDSNVAGKHAELRSKRPMHNGDTPHRVHGETLVHVISIGSMSKAQDEIMYQYTEKA